MAKPTTQIKFRQIQSVSASRIPRGNATDGTLEDSNLQSTTSGTVETLQQTNGAGAGDLVIANKGTGHVQIVRLEAGQGGTGDGKIDNIVIGSTGAAAGTFTSLIANDSLQVNANAEIIGDTATEIQLNVKAHSGQSTSIFNVELQNGDDKLTVDQSGNTTAASLIATVAKISSVGDGHIPYGSGGDGTIADEAAFAYDASNNRLSTDKIRLNNEIDFTAAGDIVLSAGTAALEIKDAGATLMTFDTTNDKVIVNEDFDVTSGSTVDFSGNVVGGVGTPIADADAATKKYVDDAREGLIVKDPVYVVTRDNSGMTYSSAQGRLEASANGEQSASNLFDQQLLRHGDRVLVKSENNKNRNGIYEVTQQGSAGGEDAALVLDFNNVTMNGGELAGRYFEISRKDDASKRRFKVEFFDTADGQTAPSMPDVFTQVGSGLNYQVSVPLRKAGVNQARYNASELVGALETLFIDKAGSHFKVNGTGFDGWVKDSGVATSFHIKRAANEPFIVDHDFRDVNGITSKTGSATRVGVHVRQHAAGASPLQLVRTEDANYNGEIGEFKPGSFMFVTTGQQFADTGFVMSSDVPMREDQSDAVGADIEFAQFSSKGVVGASKGVAKDANDIQLAISTLTGALNSTQIATGDLIAVSDTGTSTGPLGGPEQKKVSLSDLVSRLASGGALAVDGGDALALDIADNAVGLDELAGIARGRFIIGDSSGNPSLVAAADAAGEIFVASNANGDLAPVGVSGDAALAASGALTIQDGAIDANMIETFYGSFKAGSTLNLIAHDAFTDREGLLKDGGADWTSLSNCATHSSNTMPNKRNLLNANKQHVQLYLNGQKLRHDKGSANDNAPASDFDFRFVEDSSQIAIKLSGSFIESGDIVEIYLKHIRE